MTAKRIIEKSLYIGMIACFCFCAQYCYAQKVETTIDKRDILIGEQLQYTVKATYPTSVFRIHWFTLPDSLAHFEVVERGKIDSAVSGSTTTLQQTITYTSFDSGRWNTPGLMINFDPVKDDTAVNLFSDSIPVNVSYSPADSSGQLRDIKPIMEVKITDYTWYYIAGGAVVLLLLIYLLWRYLKNRKRTGAGEWSSRTAYEDAMAALEKLKGYDLQQKDSIKAYHTSLSAILREYLSRKQSRNLLNSTSSDVLIILSSLQFDSTAVAETAAALRTGDAVKFAKYLPPAVESEESLARIRMAIQLAEQKINQPAVQEGSKK